MIRGLTFRYGPHAEPVIADLDLTIAPGEHLVIVGTSGAGKSTLVNLLAGLLDPDSGDVRLGGTALPDVPPGALPNLRTLIPQQAYVFAGTVRENLTYLRPDATGPEIRAAAEALGGTPLLDRLAAEHGLDTLVAPAALSSGERQLLTLIRAYLSRAPITFLDEATCYLDPTAEARIESAFRRRPGTLVVIAHRISSALRADRVLLLDGEDTVVGTHDALVTTSRRYAELVGHWDAPDVPNDNNNRLRAYQIARTPFPRTH
jgi:ATP-binding cassette subfamily C protein